MYCSNCGNKVSENAVFCEKCGTNIRGVRNEVRNEVPAAKNGITATTFFSIGLLISFFLPWVDFRFFTVSGYNIPASLEKLLSLGNALESFGNALENILGSGNATTGNNLNGSDENLIKLTYLLYLIPVCSAYNIFRDFTQAKKFRFSIEFILGLIASILVILFIITRIEDGEGLKYLSFGFYLTAGFSVLGFLSSIFTSANALLRSDNTFMEKLNVSAIEKMLINLTPNWIKKITRHQSFSNVIGTFGFVLALMTAFLCWVPVLGWILGWILWILGFVFSLAGVFKKPMGFAIAGLVLSCIDYLILNVLLCLSLINV